MTAIASAQATTPMPDQKLESESPMQDEADDPVAIAGILQKCRIHASTLPAPESLRGPRQAHLPAGTLYGPPGTPQPQAGIGSVCGSQVSPRFEFIRASRDPHSM